MKKIIILLISILSTGLFHAQNRAADPAKETVPAEKSEVPTLVTDVFTKEHPGADGMWTKDGDNYKVQFTDPATRMMQVIVYDKKGVVIRKEGEADMEKDGKPLPDQKTSTPDKKKTSGSKK